MASDYLTLGRGEVWFAPFATGTKVAGGYRFLGNCPAFNLNVTIEELTHMDSTQGVKEEDESVVTTRSVGGSIQCDDLRPANLADFFLGESSTVSQSSATSTDEDFLAVEPGYIYQIGVTNATPTGVKSVTVTNVEDDAGTPNVFTVNTDYIIDSDRGTIQIVEGGGIASGTNLTVTYTAAASTYTQVISGRTQVEGALMFKAANAVGKDIDYRMPYAKLRPEGDLALVGDDWISFNFTVKGLLLPNRKVLYADGQPVV